MQHVKNQFPTSTIYSLKRLRCNRLNVILKRKIGTVKKRLKQINQEDRYYVTGLFRSYKPYQV